MAKKFHFRLEAVRRVRELARDAQRRVVAQRVRIVTGVQERIKDLMLRKEDSVVASRREQSPAILDTPSIIQQQVERNWLHAKVGEASEELAARQAELKAEQEKLAEAAKRLKAIEKLRDKQWERHRVLVTREEQAAGDEASMQMHLRRRVPVGSGDTE